MASRAEMDEALKRIVIPYLREVGFKGSMPNFRRLRDGVFDLLSIGHSQWGGRFCVEIARVGPEGIHLPGRHVPVDKAKTFHTRWSRRLGGRPPVVDHWFAYEHSPAEEVAGKVLAELRDPTQWELLDARPVG